MILKYGTYAHDNGEVHVVISKEKQYAELGQQTHYIEKWTIDGVLQAATVAALTTAINALEVAYQVNGQNLILYDSDGTTATSHALTNNNTASGVRITKLEFPKSEGGEYTTFRTYKIDAEAVTILQNQNLDFETWTETVTLRGGGPRFIFLQTLLGAPQKQLVAESTPYFGLQSGSAVGFQKYPNFPLPLWPAHEHIDRRELSRVSPQVQPNQPIRYQIEWSYEFESVTRLIGVPEIP